MHVSDMPHNGHGKMKVQRNLRIIPQQQQNIVTYLPTLIINASNTLNDSNQKQNSSSHICHCLSPFFILLFCLTGNFFLELISVRWVLLETKLLEHVDCLQAARNYSCHPTPTVSKQCNLSKKNLKCTCLREDRIYKHVGGADAVCFETWS